jgi:hypothetical protein
MTTITDRPAPVAAEMDPRLRQRRIEVRRMEGRRRLRRLGIVVGLVTVAFGGVALSRSALFDVDEVVIDGAIHSDGTRLAEIAGVALHQPLLEVDTRRIEAELEEQPWVLDARIERSPWGRVRVTIVERTAVSALLGEEGWLLVDADGRVLDVVPALPDGIVPIDGARWRADPGALVPGELMSGLEVASSLPSALASHVSSVVSGAVVGDEAAGIELLLYGGGRVELGDVVDLEDKYLAALTLLERAPLACLERIDVRAPEVPVLTRVPNCS